MPQYGKSYQVRPPLSAELRKQDIDPNN